MLVTCKCCKDRVAETATTCPHCGVNSPGRVVGTLLINRTRAFTGARQPMQVVVDGDYLRDLKDGESVAIKLQTGVRRLELRGGGLSSFAELTILEDRKTVVSTHFSEFGILGGGLVVKNHDGTLSAVPAEGDGAAPMTSPVPGVVYLFPLAFCGFIVLCLLAAAIFR